MTSYVTITIRDTSSNSGNIEVDDALKLRESGLLSRLDRPVEKHANQAFRVPMAF